MAMAAGRAATSRNPARAAAAARFARSSVRMLGDEGKATEKLAREAVGREIQQKKEELYDVIAKAEQSYGTRSFQNMRLLQHLSVQVSPRPWDWEWRHLRFSRRLNSVLEMAGVITLGCVASHYSKQYKTLLDGDLGLMQEEARAVKHMSRACLIRRIHTTQE